MRRARPLALLPFLLLHLPPAWCEPALDVLVYPNAGVFESLPGQPGGPGGAMLERMQALSGITLRQQVVPIPRALLLAEQKPGSCAVAVSRTAEREPRFLWVGPWARGAMTIYGRADEGRPVDRVQDLRGRSVIVLRDSSPAAWLREQGVAAEEVKDNGTALRMLQARRVDFWVANDLAAHFVIRANGAEAPRVLHSVGRIDLYFACHKSTDPATTGTLELAIAQLRRNGELAEFGLGR
ncbi:MAG: transporter substrate-binding domain-containing protein [Rubrivivax sp.]|nr:MAG: transporter substrate-binding domain-containing protein [Rubrivivax sp.]